MKPFISLCIIVKNEEKVIERCLSSVVNYIDEIIVVDTGSVDNTKEIASKYTSNIFDFEWTNDFSAARNYAATKASGEWIIVLDADEYVDGQNFNELINELKEDNDTYDAYTAKIINFSGNYGENLIQNYHDRIYRNNGEISYKRKIHEQFHKTNGTPLKTKNSSLIIFHSGYLTQTVNEKNKSQRNQQLLDDEMNKGERKAFDYFNYGNEYYSIGDYQKALDAYLQAYNLKSDFHLAWVPTTLIQIIMCLLNLKRYSDALDIINDAENIFESSPEFPYLKGFISIQRGQFEDAKAIFLEMIKYNSKYTNIIIRPDLKEEKPHQHLGEIFFQQEDFNSAIYHYASVLNVNKYNVEGIKRVINILSKFHSDNEITSFLNTKELINSKNITSYVKACFEIANPLLAISLLEGFNDDNKLFYEVALLKKLCILNEGNIEDIKEIFQFDVIKNLVESNLVNVIDLYLLRTNSIDEISSTHIFNYVKEDKSFNSLTKVLGGKGHINQLDENLLLYSLQLLINYKKYPLIDTLLADIENADKKVITKVAGLLFSNGYKVEALQLYELGDWNDYKPQDLINIITSLLETNNNSNAIDFAKYGIVTFEDDFRFYEFILEYTDNEKLFQVTLDDAKHRFKDSRILEKYELLR